MARGIGGCSEHLAAEPVSEFNRLRQGARSIIHAIHAVDGKLLWRYDPEVPQQAVHQLRHSFGSRGIAWWNGKVYAGTHDGRLIAIDGAPGSRCGAS